MKEKLLQFANCGILLRGSTDEKVYLNNAINLDKKNSTVWLFMIYCLIAEQH